MNYFTIMLSGLAARNELKLIDDCICPGQRVTYECTVVGGVVTVWSGTIMEIDCEIILRHYIIYLNSYRTCNNGAVIGQGVEVNNNCFTSQLTVLLTPDLNQRTIRCSVVTGDEIIAIGVAQLLFTTGSIKI